MGRKWTDADLAILRRDFADMPTRELAARLGRTQRSVSQAAGKFGLRKSPEQLARSRVNSNASLTEAGKPYRRRKGEPPWNAGLRYIPGGRAVETQFRPGHKPQTWVPIGTERTNKDGLTVRKVADTGDRRTDWKPLHVIEWESKHGPVPPGMVVLTTLELVSRAELMRRNSVQRLPTELRLAVQLVGALNRQIRKRA